MLRSLSDYALIGDCETAALVSRDGSIDWLCWPRFDSGACFAAPLGTADHGRWLITAEHPAPKLSRKYRNGSLVLETRVETDDGACTIIDFMPTRGSTSDLVRTVVGETGRMRLISDLALRFDDGRLIPSIKKPDDGGLDVVSGPHAVAFHAPVDVQIENGRIRSGFEVRAGERLSFVLTYRKSHRSPPSPIDAEEALERTHAEWRDWSSQCRVQGPRREAVIRSLITIKALTYKPTGGMSRRLPPHCRNGSAAAETGIIGFAGFAMPR